MDEGEAKEKSFEERLHDAILHYDTTTKKNVAEAARIGGVDPRTLKR